MMNFPAPGFVFRMLGEKNGCLRHGLQKEIYAYGKIRGPYETGLRVDDSFARSRKLVEPAGGADNRVDAENGEAANIFRRGFGHREFNGNVDAAQRFVRESLPMRIVAAGKCRAYFEAILRREALDEPAHFSVADDGKPLAHAPAAPVARSCLAIRA